MKCPACGAELVSMTSGEITLDVCSLSCGGVWFDHDELLKFDEQIEPISPEVMKIITKKREVTLDRDKIRQCPKCDKEVLVRQFFDHENLIEMDQCWNCAGVWLDPGELLAIRKQYHTYEERKQAAQDYFSEQSKNISKFTKERIEYYKSSVDPDSIKSKDVDPDSGHSKDTKLTWEKVCRVITESLARRFLKGR